MTEIKIFCVTTDIKHDYQRDCVNQLQKELLTEFGGMTVIENTKGLWLDENKQIVTDTTDIWLIITNKQTDLRTLWELNEKLRKVTNQSVQFFSVDGLPFYVDKPL